METGIIWVTTFSPKKEDYHEQSSRYYWSFFKGSQIEKNYSFSGRNKRSLVDVIDAYEAEDESSDKLDLLTEALDALEDANDALNDASDEA